MESIFANITSRDIHAIARYMQQHIHENWEIVFQDCRDEMIARYDEIGDSVYGIYGSRLFRHIHDQFREAGLRATPRLPGNFSISREWGPEDDRQRWMWSKITLADSTAIGTIVTVFYHDHLQIRIPHPFQVIGLELTTKGDVVKALSHLSVDFKAALEAKIEIAQYLAENSN